MGAQVMDLSKCGGVCRGACKHYAIGVECPPDATYEPVEVTTACLSLDGIKEWMVETEGKGGIARRDHIEWLIAKVDSLTETAQLFRNTAEDYAEKIGKLRKDLDFERGTNNFDATRLRRLATLVGRSVPESDETLLACAGTVIGGIALSVEKLFKDHKLALEGLHSLMVERDSFKIEVARLSDALSAVMADEWRDAGQKLPQVDPETCHSKDVLGCWPQGGMMVVYYDACKGWIDSEGGEPCVAMPTHWQPLPDAPVYQTVQQRWKLICKGCGVEERWEAKDFFEAADSLPSGWGYDQVLKGSVCPRCKA